MGEIAEWLQLRKPQINELVNTTSQTVLNSMMDDVLLDEYFPIKTYLAFELLWLQFKTQGAIASVVGWEGEIPGTRSGSITEVALDVFKLGIAHHYTENLLKMMYDFEQRSLAVPALMAEFKNILFGTIDDLKPRINGLMKLMTWQVLTTGSCDYLDPRTKIRAKVTYNILPTLFPTALLAGRRWSVPTTATGIADLVALTEAYYAVHRRFPDKVVMSRKQVNNLLLQDATRTAAVSRVASGAAPASYVVNRELLNILLTDRQVPPIVEYDTEVEVEAVTIANGIPIVSTTPYRLVPDNVVCFLSKSRGQGGVVREQGVRALGPVPSNKMKAGIYVFPEAVSIEPPVDRVVGVATFVPAVFDDRALCAQRVDG